MGGTLYAPTFVVRQMNIDPVDPDDELEFEHVNYSFSRKTRWTTILDFYADQQFEIMPQQLLMVQELTIHREEWTPDEIEALEGFVDAHMGSAYSFYVVAPDSGESLVVRFRDDDTEYSVPDAVVRSGDLILFQFGDFDGSVNNGLVYPDYVQSTTTSSSTTSTSTTSTTSTTFTYPAAVYSGVLNVVNGVNCTFVSGNGFGQEWIGYVIYIGGTPTTITSVSGDHIMTVSPPVQSGNSQAWAIYELQDTTDTQV